MEYLESINSRPDRINDKNIQYLNVLKHPSLVYGNTIQSERVNFCKYDENIHEEMIEYGEEIDNNMLYHQTSACGVRIRFKTNSRRLIFKVELKRAENYLHMVTWNSSGFDVHFVDKKGKYTHYKLIAPKEGNNIFADEMLLPQDSSVCIFLPNFDTIKQFYLGFQKGSKVSQFKYPKNRRTPIIFYGNGITQGSAATKSGNSYPNIVSRWLNRDIINFSMDKCCKAPVKMAEMLGKIDCDSIIMDYSRDADNLEELEEHHERFYKLIRKSHPNKRIIILTTAVFNKSKKYESYDEIIIKTYENAVERGENTLLLNQRELFSKVDFDLVSVDGCHYNDYAMFKVANKICRLLKS